MRDWSKYIENTKGKAHTPLLAEALSYAKNKDSALDLGCGAMSDIDAILEADFKQIDAVDSNDAITEIAEKKRVAGAPLTFYQVPFHDFRFRENAYDLINAQNAIPFAGPEHVEGVMKGVRRSIKHGGVFVGTFFGHDDDWASDPTVVSHSREFLEEFFNSKEWKIYKFDEEQINRPTASGKQKHWHIFHVIARKIN